MRQFLDLVHQAVELPLCIHFLLPAQGEGVELLVVPQDVLVARFHHKINDAMLMQKAM